MNQGPLKTYLTDFAAELRWVEAHQLREETISDVYVLDVRERHEYDAVRIERAINLPRGRIELDVETLIRSQASPIVLICKTDLRARLAYKTLTSMGYSNLRVLKGGMDHWSRNGGATIGGTGLEQADFERYARHLSLPDFNSAHQKRLKEATVLIVGCGGLGSPVIAYLAAAGLGTLRLADFDRVDVSNLQRQMIHQTADVGRAKVESAKDFVCRLNPNVEVQSNQLRVDESSVAELIRGVDVVVDGSDSLQTRYLLNAACVQQEIPYVYGAVFRDEGEFAFFGTDAEAACYRCLHPNPMPQSLTPTCAQTGVLGVVPGMVGMLQANATLNFVLGKMTHGATQLTRLSFGDFRTNRFTIERQTNCPVCTKALR